MWVIPECMVFILESSSLILESLQWTPEEREKRSSSPRYMTCAMSWQVNSIKISFQLILSSQVIKFERKVLDFTLFPKNLCVMTDTWCSSSAFKLSLYSYGSSYLQFLLSYSISFRHCLGLIFFFPFAEHRKSQKFPWSPPYWVPYTWGCLSKLHEGTSHQ